MAKQKGSIPATITATLFGLARALDEQGKIHQSLDPYLKVVVQHPDSPEASLATDRLFEIIDAFRGAGQIHMAMRLLERLETALPQERSDV